MAARRGPLSVRSPRLPLPRPRVLVGVVAAAVLGLTGCLQTTGGDPLGTVTTSRAGVAAAPAECFTGLLTGEGSSAQKSALEDTVTGYRRGCPEAKVSYSGSGSAAGVRQFIARQVDFAGADAPLDGSSSDARSEAGEAARACAAPAWNVPVITVPVALAYRLDGVDDLVLTPEVTAGIFSGRLTTWNDPAISRINPGTSLPPDPIKVFFRSDLSGTTHNFTSYLAGAAAPWWTAVPAQRWPGPVGAGREKSAGVVRGVQNANGGITYVDWSYARAAQLRVARIDNGAGPVELTSASVSTAVNAAARTRTSADLALTVDAATREPDAYPIIGFSYLIVCSRHRNPAQGARVRAFLSYYLSSAVQQGLADLGHVPLPERLRVTVAAAAESLR